jgi:hypothetical protein
VRGILDSADLLQDREHRFIGAMRRTQSADTPGGIAAYGVAPAPQRRAWQRLIRVIGHEINNSLAPLIARGANGLGARLEVLGHAVVEANEPEVVGMTSRANPPTQSPNPSTSRASIE